LTSMEGGAGVPASGWMSAGNGTSIAVGKT
jgi:hypothetical protein